MEIINEFEKQMRLDEERGLLPKGYTDKILGELK